MACPAPATNIDEPVIDDDTDYGSDFSVEEAEIVEQLISGIETAIEDNPIVTNGENHSAQSTLRLPRILGREQRSPLFEAARAAEMVAQQLSDLVENAQHYSDLANQPLERTTKLDTSIAPAPGDPKVPDIRSPLLRFRTEPKRALSVTDLVSPAWCELQYWYTLTLHGRKRPTPAMKRGTIVHKILEDQVHTSIKVDVQTKEDAWGLRIWNVIQGLRTLRDTGQTRELEVWGTVDGLVVNGVIDELSYVCPNNDLEQSFENAARASKTKPPSDQPTIAEFFKAEGDASLKQAIEAKREFETNHRVYICDVKTRSVRSLPKGAAFRPTKMQLMLYHTLLASLATNKVDFSILVNRYSLDSTKVFSDAFIAQVGSLNDDEIVHDAQSSPDPSQESLSQWSQDSMSTLLAHNNLTALWSLMISEFQITLPDGKSSLGNILKAEYRSSDAGEILGSKTIAMDEAEVGAYVKNEMQWWRGEREPQGVGIQEAFKCRSCEFAEGCEWRLKKVDEARERARSSLRRTSAG